jgi:hypothetical protein
MALDFTLFGALVVALGILVIISRRLDVFAKTAPKRSIGLVGEFIVVFSLLLAVL